MQADRDHDRIEKTLVIRDQQHAAVFGDIFQSPYPEIEYHAGNDAAESPQKLPNERCFHRADLDWARSIMISTTWSRVRLVVSITSASFGIDRGPIARVASRRSRAAISLKISL